MTFSSKTASTSNLSGSIINNDYLLSTVLGSGASGTVYLAKHLYSHKEFAIKVIAKPNARAPPSTTPQNSTESRIQSKPKSIFATPIPMSLDKQQNLDPNHPMRAFPSLYNEVSLHSVVHSHPNILSVVEVLDSLYYICVVLDYCELGDLFTAITERNWYVGDENMARNLFLQLLDAVEHCHTKSVFHCDLKPENILVDRQGTQLKIADFGLASRSPLCTVFGRGSSYYMAPETIAENTVYRKKSSSSSSFRRRRSDSNTSQALLNFNQQPKPRTALQSKGYPRAASDVWALGIIFLNLVFGRNPWKKASMVEDPAYRDYSYNYNTLKGILPVSEELNCIMAAVFHPDPYRRISVARFRESIVNCRAFTNSAKEFPWFRTITPPAEEEVSVIVEQTPVQFQKPKQSPSKRSSVFTTKIKESKKETTSVYSDVTYVHIENVKTKSVEVVTSPRAASPTQQSIAKHIGSQVITTVISPPITVTSNLGSSSLGSSTDVSVNTSCSSVSSVQRNKRKMRDHQQLPFNFEKISNSPLVHLYPVTPEKSLVTSAATLSDTKVMFHPNTNSLCLYSVDQMLPNNISKKIRSTSLYHGQAI